MSDCLFCRIASGEIPAAVVYRDDEHLAFMDIGPVNAGHLLVVPHRHFESAATMPSEAVGRLFALGSRLAGAAVRAVGADGYNLTTNSGPAAGQIVMHTHVHAIPRFADDGLKHWGSREMPAEEIEALAERVRQALAE